MSPQPANNAPEVEYTSGLSDLVLNTLTRFINLPLHLVESEITLALKDIGTFVSADRVYIFTYDLIRETTSNSHEWCGEGVAPQIEMLQDLPMTLFPEWWAAHRQGRAMQIEDVSKMPDDVGLRKTLQEQGIKTLLALPMMDQDRCIGFVGFDWVNNLHACAPHEYEILEVFARMLTNISLRKQADKDRARLQDKIAHMAKLESLGRLAGGVAHDFNNLLMVIQSHCRLAEMKLPAESPIKAHINGIIEAADRSADLTGRLLAFARKQEIKPELIDLNERINRAIHMLRHAMGPFVTIDWQPGEKIWPVKMDPGQLEQILTNLCVNAKDAIHDRGKITIATSNIQRPVTDDEGRVERLPVDYARLVIRDTGSGMDQATLARIFEPFFTTKPAGKGTGLGLSTVFGIVNQNQGLIEVDSAPGRGTTFSIYLRRDRES